MIAYAILPDHLHVIWQLPEGDPDYSTRWRLVKSYVTRKIRDTGKENDVLWQKRYWEHTIRNQNDLDKHIDFIHYNPVKHGLSENPASWKFSSFNAFYDDGNYPPDWGKIEPKDMFTGVVGE